MFVNAVSDPNQVLFCPVPSKRVHLRPDQQHCTTPRLIFFGKFTSKKEKNLGCPADLALLVVQVATTVNLRAEEPPPPTHMMLYY